MRTNVEEKGLGKSISFVGFLGMGIGCVFGSSWLVMTNIWLDNAGGPLNCIYAFVVGLIMILILALAYAEIIPMFPSGGGEMIYCHHAYGEFAAMIAGWCGFLVNLILCAWQTLAITKMMSFLFPSIKSATVLYEIGNIPVTLPSILLGLFLVISIAILHLKGTKIFTRIQTALTSVVLGLVVFGICYGFTKFNIDNLKPLAIKPTFEGTLSVLVILPFSIAGWENIAKGVEEADADLDPSKISKAMIVSIIIATFMYAMALIVQTGLMPWQELKHSEVPFVTGLMEATGKPYLGTVLLIAACFNIIGVYSGMFYGATRALYSLGKFGLIPEAFSKIHPKYNTPYISIIFISCLIGITPFIGEWAFQPLVNVAAFLYIVLWGSTVLAVTKLRKNAQNNNVSKPYLSKIKSTLGILVIVFMILSMLIPKSPGALSWPSEHILLVVLIILGIVLYGIKKLKYKDKKA